MYSTLSACILIFTFLAGHYDGERSAAIVLENRYLKGGNAALSKRLNEFKNGSGGTTAAAGNNNNKKGKQKVWGRVIKVPDDWESWGFYDIHHGFKCAEHANDMNKPLPDMEFWTYYRNVYKNVVDKDVVQFNDPIPPTEGYTLTTTNGEEKQPYYAKRSPGKGRGLFASRDIKKGEVVHDGTNSDVIMSGKDFRRFLFALPQKMACDATEWVSVGCCTTLLRESYISFLLLFMILTILIHTHTHTQSINFSFFFHSRGHSNPKRMAHSLSVLHSTFPS